MTDSNSHHSSRHQHFHSIYSSILFWRGNVAVRSEKKCRNLHTKGEEIIKRDKRRPKKREERREGGEGKREIENLKKEIIYKRKSYIIICKTLFAHTRRRAEKHRCVHTFTRSSFFLYFSSFFCLKKDRYTRICICTCTWKESHNGLFRYVAPDARPHPNAIIFLNRTFKL